MNVCAVSTPRQPGWRWRITNHAGEIVEESSRTFTSIADAVAEGTTRMVDLGINDVSVRANPYRWSPGSRRGR